MKTTAALTAKAIKAELKSVFPAVKFRITSKTYSGGCSVSVSWVDGPNEKTIDEIVNKYEYGHFNGMEDLYEYDNVRKDIPQVKYLFTHRDMSEGVKSKLTQIIESTYGNLEKFGHWSLEQIMHREYMNLSYPEYL